MADLPIVNGLFRHDNTVAPEQPSLMAMFSLKGKTATVTGAASGIGLSVAKALAEAGANIVIWYNTNMNAIQRAAKIEAKYGVRCICKPLLIPSISTSTNQETSRTLGRAYQVNTRDYECVEEITNMCVKEMNGRLDIFVANYGISWTRGPMVDATLDHYVDVVQTDLDGVFYCAKAVAAHW